MRSLAWSLAILICLTGSASGAPPALAGSRLDEALQHLQREGLPIVFSSEIVTPAMRVVTEPRATTPREQLDELLAAHGLKAEAGPGGTILVVRDHGAQHRAARAPVAPGPSQPASSPPASPGNASTPDSGTRPSGAAVPGYTDHVTVGAPDGRAMHRGTETNLNTDRIKAATGPLESDGLNAVRTLPGVVAGNDFRTDFSVRGSPYDQIGVVIDGVPTRWLQHTMYRRRDAGSLSMFGSDLLDRITLQAGAFPRLYDDALGAQVDLNIREGSREATRLTGAAGGLTAAVNAEGPIGANRDGSWTVGLRESYESWPARGAAAGDPGFGFADLHGKLVYDVSPREQLTVTALAGRSALDTTDQTLGALYGSGTDTAGLVTASLRSTLSARTFLQQRVYFAGRALTTDLPSEPLARQVVNNTLGYRGEAFHTVFGGLVHGGVEIANRSGSQDAQGNAVTVQSALWGAEWTTRAAFVNFAASVPHDVTFQLGARASDSTLVRHGALSPWALASWRIRPAWTVSASAGQSHQFPEIDALIGLPVRTLLVPEQATNVDLGIENHLAHLEWHATLFQRLEHDILRPPIAQPLLIGGVLAPPPGPQAYANALDGSARGVEVGAASDASRRLSGWWSYTYSRTRQTDLITGQTFWADLDRRHVINATGTIRAGATGMDLTLRDASGVPIAGYFQLQNGALFAGDLRNQVRLPAYVRLDVRLHRIFFASQHAVTLSAELLNAFNRQNVGIGDGIVQPVTGEADGFTKALEGRRFAVGIGISFSR